VNDTACDADELRTGGDVRSGFFLRELRGLLRADFFFEMTAIHVADFMCEHTGEFGFVVADSPERRA